MVGTKYLLYILFPAIQAISHKDHQTNVLATENKNLRNKQQMIMLFSVLFKNIVVHSTICLISVGFYYLCSNQRV